MKGDQLKKDIGKHFRLRPLPERWDHGIQLEPRDDFWSLDQVSKQHIKITNLATGHTKEIGLDNIREYRSPDYLLLHCQLKLRGNAVEIEPLLHPITILNDEQERLLRTIAQYQQQFGAPKLRIAREGSGLAYPEHGVIRQVHGVDIGLDLFGPQQSEVHRRARLESVMDSIPDEYLRRLPEAIYDSPFVVAVTPKGLKYLGIPQSPRR